MRILCLQHVPFEGPGAFLHWAEQRGHALEIFSLYEGKPLPTLPTFDCLLMMGGPMGVADESAYPWMGAEKRLLRETIAAGKPVIGVCLGAQLLAEALGSRVYPGEQKEIGWFPIQFSPTAAARFSLPSALTVFHWHGETFDLPEDALHLAASDLYPQQGFLARDRFLGLQFHVEVTPESLATMVQHGEAEIAVGGDWVQSGQRMRAVPSETFASLHQTLFQLLDRLLGKN